jgi:hypothetical protein
MCVLWVVWCVSTLDPYIADKALDGVDRRDRRARLDDDPDVVGACNTNTARRLVGDLPAGKVTRPRGGPAGRRSGPGASADIATPPSTWRTDGTPTSVAVLPTGRPRTHCRCWTMEG